MFFSRLRSFNSQIIPPSLSAERSLKSANAPAERSSSAAGAFSSSTSRADAPIRRAVVVLFLAASTLFASTAFVGCFSGKKDSDAVAAISSPAVEQATSDALQELQRLTVLNGKENATLCFLGVSGKGDPGALSAATRQQIETRSSFRLLEKSAVQAALKESDVRANNLFIPAERKKFIDALGEPVDYLLAGYVEKGSVPTDAANDSGAQNNVSSNNSKTTKIFKLELVELETNRKFEFVAPL